MKKFGEKEQEAIVRHVCENPCIWDKSRRDFRDATKKDNIFLKISKEMNRDVLEVDRCWYALRDKYKREKMNENHEAPRSGAAGGKKTYKKSKWPLMDCMSFLDKDLHPKNGQESFLPPSATPSTSKQSTISTMISCNSVKKQSSDLHDVEYLLIEDDTISPTLLQSESLNSTMHSTPEPVFNFQEMFPDTSQMRPKNANSHIENAPDQPLSATLTDTNDSTNSLDHHAKSVDIACPKRNADFDDDLTTQFPKSKKKRNMAETLQEERQVFMKNMNNIMLNASNNSTSAASAVASVAPVTAEEQMANAYGEYIKTKFKNWNIPKQIEGFKIINEAIEKFEDMNKD